MTVMFLEGFEHWSTAIMSEDPQPKWKEWWKYGSNADGRFGIGRSYHFGGTTYWLKSDSFNTGTSDRLIVGFGYKTSAKPVTSQQLIQFKDDADVMMTIEMQPDGTIDAIADSTIVASTTIPLYVDVWHYVEVKVLFKTDTTGDIEMQIDGELAAAETGKKTITAGTECDSILWRSTQNVSVYIDDIYIAHDNAAADDFLGDVKVITRVPTADSGTPDFTPSAGSNWENLDDTYLDDADATYNSSNTSGHEDLFTCATFGLQASDTVHAVNVNLWHEKADGGAADMYVRLDNGAGTATSGAKAAVADWLLHNELWELDVDSGTPAWDYASVDTIKFGYERV